MYHQLLCGVYGALASIAGKFTFAQDSPIIIIIAHTCEHTGLPLTSCLVASWLCRCCCFALMISLNALMVSTFLTALDNGSSAIVALVSGAVNYLVTAILGILLFEENIGSTWITGSIMISLGLLIVSYSQLENRNSSK